MASPPPPPGFSLQTTPRRSGMFAGPPRRDPDLFRPLFAEGIEATNGYRTQADIERIRTQGYKPAANSLHLKGDALDLTPGRSGLSMRDVEVRARKIAAQWPGAKVLNEGHHVHVQLPGWGMAPGTPGTPNSGLPPIPAGFELKQRGSLTGGNWAARDGDTFKLPDGRNARLSGADAWEIGQKGRTADGSLVPLGDNARAALTAALPGSSVSFTGGQTYGRPLVTLSRDGRDPAKDLIRSGNALATPEYLKGDARLSPYMEAERLARLNRLGGHGTNAETPAHFRHKDGPWQGAEPGKWGDGVAVFGDEPTPNAGLRPEIAAQYLAIWNDPKSKPEDLIAFAKASGFELSEKEVRQQYSKRFKGGDTPDDEVNYRNPPTPVTDPGDGKSGTFLRGLGDPINMIDELGGVVDALGGTDGRESVWNSNRRFGDILWNNIDQNRAILRHDDATAPMYRLGGQLTSGVLLPFGGAAKTPAALARVGAIEGGLAGFGAGEGGVADRLPGAAAGAAFGGSGGYLLGRVADDIARRYSVAGPRSASSMVQEAGFEAAPILNSGLQNLGPTPAARSQPPGGALGTMALHADDAGAAAVTPPAGFIPDAPFGVTRPMGQPLTAPEIAKLGGGVDPASVITRPANTVATLEEALKANPGTVRLIEQPDEFSYLQTRKLGGTRPIYVKGPLDVSQRLRTWGGLRDEGGELSYMGLTNVPRRMDFGSNEGFLGKLVNENGLTLDDAAVRLHEAGYFDHVPSRDDLLDALRAEAGGGRNFARDDLNELANFEAAREQRLALQKAADEGTPIYEDVGQSITLDDLDAKNPPAAAYEERPRLTGKIGNINLDRLERPEDVAQLIDHIQKRVGGFGAAARGRITHEETSRLAAEIGLTPEQLLRRRPGNALNAEQLYASRALVQKSREAVASLAKRAVGGSDDDVLAFRRAWVRHVALEEQISGATAEAGRALQQFRMLAKGGDARGEAVRAYLKGAGGREKIEDAAQAIVDLMEDPAKAGHFMREALKPRWRDKFNELWINSLLSGPKTHVVNFVGNALTSIYSLPEQALTAGIGKVLGSADRSYMGEVGARLSGLANSSIEGLRRARQAFKTGEPFDAVSKVEAIHHRAIGGKVGEVVRIPTRALTAADEFWKTINSNAELHALAYRRALQQGKSPEERKALYERLLRSPTEEMSKAAEEAARYYTFQRELGPIGRSVMQFSNEMPGGKILMPFVRTPINLLKFAGERSMFAPLMPEVRQALRQGGRARDEALARITLGSGLSTAAVMAAMDGRVTGGGPSDPRERQALTQSGWQPYSMKVGDRWISYQRFEPLSLLFGAAADFAEVGRYATPKEADKFAMALAQGVAKNITSKTWLSGLSDAFDALSDPERYGEGYVRRLASSLAIPSVVNQVAQSTDPYLRDARNIVDAVKARVPVVSEGLPVKRNVWGEPIERGDSVGPDLLSPVFSSHIDQSAAAQEVARLRVPMVMPDRSITVEGESVELSAKQYDELVQLSGKPARAYVEGFVRSAEYQAMNDAERSAAIKEAMNDFRAAGREALKERYPELGGGTEFRAIPRHPDGFVPPPAGFVAR